MLLFLWKRVDDLTTKWHSDGGLVVVAATLERARELCPAVNETPPDKTFTLADPCDEGVFIFPNAGCC